MKRDVALANMNRSNVIHCLPFVMELFLEVRCCMCTPKTWFYFFWS